MLDRDGDVVVIAKREEAWRVQRLLATAAVIERANIVAAPEQRRHSVFHVMLTARARNARHEEAQRRTRRRRASDVDRGLSTIGERDDVSLNE